MRLFAPLEESLLVSFVQHDFAIFLKITGEKIAAKYVIFKA